METGTLAAIIGSVTVAASAIIAGFWQWINSRKKTDLDAQSAMLNGFVVLLSEFKTERSAMILRLNELETTNQKQDRRIAMLESFIIENRLKMPLNETHP